MKIAIITLPLHGNYGGILQNYALQTVLKRMGYFVETITFPMKRELPYWKMPLAYSKRIISKYILHRRELPILCEQWYNWTYPLFLHNVLAFIETHVSRRCVNSFVEIGEDDYDVLIVGSDQVWRPKYFGHSIKDAYLGFAEDWRKVKRVAYAVSFGTDVWEYTSKQTQKCVTLAALFNGISVREEAAVTLCQEHLHVNAKHVLDPTLLLNEEDYVNLFKDKPLVMARGQLLTYVLDETPEKTRIIARAAEHFNYKVYQANSRYEDKTAPLRERIQPSVEQWLKDFYEAKFIITDSFHACVFSILFQKPFIMMGKTGASLRLRRPLICCRTSPCTRTGGRNIAMWPAAEPLPFL